MNKYVNSLVYFFKFLKYLHVLTSGENNEQNLIFSNLVLVQSNLNSFSG